MVDLLYLIAATGEGGDNPSGAGGVVIIVAIAFVVLALFVGALVLRGRRGGTSDG
jgi:hypothetical protein